MSKSVLRAAGAFATALVLFVYASSASAQEIASPFACLGEAQAIENGMSVSDMMDERDARIAEPAPPGEAPATRANRLCVIAELMSRLGDSRASSYFEQAIASAPDEGGYELWYGQYLGGVRGSSFPLIERAEVHLYRALDKLKARHAKGDVRSYDAITEEWVQRRLIDLYQADGFQTLPWKGFPYASSGENAPGLALTAEGRVAAETYDFTDSTDDIADVRKFTAEAAFATSVERLDRKLTLAEGQAIAQAPLRYAAFGRGRIRQNILGSLDFSYRSLWLDHGQIMRYDQPTNFVNAQAELYGVTWKRAFDLYPVVDATIEASYFRVDRVGVVEYFPNEWEHFNVIEAKPSISRFLGPDKLTLGTNFIYMIMPDIVGGEVDQRKRGRAITAFYFDYAMYRPLLLPTVGGGGLRFKRMSTRGWHLFGGAAFDNEVYGTRLVQKRDYYGGLSFLGMGRLDLTVQGTVFQDGVTDAVGFNLAPLANAQFRTSIIPLVRIIDGDVTPGLPHGGSPAFLNLVFPMKWDVTTQGTCIIVSQDAAGNTTCHDYANFRVGAELWTRFIATGLRGTSFLISGGYAFEYFYNLDKALNIARLDVGMGW